MSLIHSGIFGGNQNGTVLIRIEGKGTHLNSHLLKQYVLQCLEEKHAIFQIDLSHCTYMDSTFLGTLAGLGSKIKERSLPPMKLLNITDRVLGMLQSLGIDHFFEVIHQPTTDMPLKGLQAKEPSKEEKARQMLEAHEKLVSISGANEVKFYDVIELLRQKVNKHPSS